MNELQIFNSAEFGTVRAMMIDGTVWFVGKDVADRLGYSNSRKAIGDHVDDEDKGVTKHDTLGGIQEMTIINESGLYSLVLSSKLPTAKAFKRWITSEVLPSIRKNGGYIMGQEKMTDAELMAQAVLVAQKTIQQRDQKIAALEAQRKMDHPKVLFADAVSASKTNILIGEMAKILKQNGVDIGQNRLFSWLRENGLLISRKGTDYNMPTQKAMEMELFRIKETTIHHADGHTSITKTVKVTGKGQQYIVNRFLGK